MNQQVDQLDAWERDEKSTDTVNKQVSSKDHACRRGAEFDAFERQWNQQDDDDRVENHRAESRSAHRVP